ncbi:25890_t:CDS:2, partial [Gigaspora rosea]
PCFRKLSEEMLEDIRFYTCSTEGIGATLQYNLLKSKYSDKYIDKKDVYNAIQRFRRPFHENLALLEDETQASFEWVLEQLHNATNSIVPKTIYSDADLAMGAALLNIWPNMHHSH